jgi:glutaconyl-CoA/methylmalonyl-CoA decarboxylase subunit gamma
MKYRVKVEGQWFEVEINDLTTQPVVAYVDGQPFEVWTESRTASSTQAERLPGPSVKSLSPKPGTLASPARKSSSSNLASTGNSTSLKAVRAPIPGVIISIAVQPPAQVAVGEELCVLEAMKMRTSIRATRNGEIIRVNITPGQHVRHQEVLMEYAD